MTSHETTCRRGNAPRTPISDQIVRGVGVGAPPVQWHWKSSDESALSPATVKGPPLCHEHETGSTPVAGCVVMVASRGWLFVNSSTQPGFAEV